MDLRQDVDNIPQMTLDIDIIDRQILMLLQNDASLSVDALADRINLSRNA